MYFPTDSAHAKLGIEDLLDVAVGDRVGLIAFAGLAQVEIPLTSDYSFFRELLRNVDTKTIEVGGTVVGDAIRLALQRFSTKSPSKKMIILITDGEDHDSLPLEAAKQAAEMKIPIITVAIGNSEGAPIPIITAQGKRIGYKTFAGSQVLSKPDVQTLKEISRITHGEFFHATSSFDMKELYQKSAQIQERGELIDKRNDTLHDRYQLFLALSLLTFWIYVYLPNNLPRAFTSQTLAFAVFIVMQTIALPTYAAPLQSAPQSEVTESRLLTKHSDVASFNRSLELQESAPETFIEIQSQLQNSHDSRVANRALFNVAVNEFKQARECQEKRGGVQTSPEPQSQAKIQNLSQKIEQYIQAKRERQNEFKAVKNLALEASTKFTQCARDPQLLEKARRNNLNVQRWINDKKIEEKELEKKFRSQALSHYPERLLWLATEYQSIIDCLDEQTLFSERKTVQDYQEQEGSREFLEETMPDVEFIVSEILNLLSGSKDESSSEGVTLARGVHKRLVASLDSAIQSMKEYDSTNSSKNLKGAKIDLLLLETFVEEYPILLDELLKKSKSDKKKSGRSSGF